MIIEMQFKGKLGELRKYKRKHRKTKRRKRDRKIPL